MTADSHLPLTPAQRRLWTLAQLRPQDPFFSVPFAVAVDGPLDTAALGRALDELVRRHPALRTRIVRGADGEPVQCVDAARPAGTAVEADVVASGERAAELADDFARTPFEVDGGPLLRVRLLRLDDTAHRLLVGVHHIVFDGASLEVFTSELAALYEAFSKGLPPPPTEPAVDYGTFLAARTARDERARGENLRYWTERLADAPEVLELPLSGPRPARGGHEGGRRTAVVPHETTEPLRRLARARRCSLYMVLKAATDVVLSRYGGVDVLTGMAVSGRDTPGSAGLIGYLTRPVVLRGDLSGDPRFEELLGAVRGDLLDALDHADLPVDEVMDALGVSRDPSYHPLYQVMYTHQPAARVHRAGEAVFRAAELRLPTMKTDLAIDTVETDEGLLAVVDYRTELFEDAAAEQLLTCLRTVLERVGADPAARVSELLRPTEAELLRSAPDGGRTAGEAVEECVHTLVAEQVARTPDAVALSAGERSWTYGELDAAAERLADRLRHRGVGPEVRVGVCAPASFELAAAHLGVLKAGGACVPLDPALPAFLLRLAVEDAEVETVLADGVSFSLFDHTRVHVVELDVARSAVPDAPAASDDGGPDARARSAGPRDAAWVLRTSGVTGEPLPVVAEHRQLASRLRWAHRELPSGALDSVALQSPPDTPGAVFELFAPLTRGGRVLVPDGDAVSGTVYAAPSQLSAPGAAGAAFVLAGGEPLAPAQVRAAYDAGARAVHHLYVTAETAGCALAQPVGADDAVRTVELGVPAGATAYVLDALGRPAPPGVVGELHIGGPAVTRGYLGRPGLTAERFRPDPFTGSPGARLFATGDLARRTPDGRLLFAGRITEQALVRGVRVAASDVRAALLAHPAVVHAEVLADAGSDADAATTGTGDADANRTAAANGTVPATASPDATGTGDSTGGAGTGTRGGIATRARAAAGSGAETRAGAATGAGAAVPAETGGTDAEGTIAGMATSHVNRTAAGSGAAVAAGAGDAACGNGGAAGTGAERRTGVGAAAGAEAAVGTGDGTRAAARGGGLVAAAVVRPGSGVTADVLRTRLAETLPGFMVPAQLEVLDRIPLLPSGRTDRSGLVTALAEAAARRTAARSATGRPASSVERHVADAWEQVLGRAVGPDVSFFDAGGNSLLLIRLRDRLRTALERDVDLIDLFRHSTVRAMAALLAGANDAAGAAEDARPAASGRAQARQLAMKARGRTRTHGRTR
ncbi:non-ribosomal peptide synthetase [Streptomyces sp. MUM 178J]|uniref:non-ribosomal peptide synthetase n=1 Tax=Streptomyces sp. MUM 178J TaxID=2791991 RepID=UPI001F038BF6|nr:condensation domain-containing protein [Streptomyces sp. MUM 178J]WRQ80362.1 condensation domain-containing protein [Streptomyces sp. MUM 178J]